MIKKKLNEKRKWKKKLGENDKKKKTSIEELLSCCLNDKMRSIYLVN